MKNLLITLIFVLGAVAAFAQSTITGTVMDASTDEPLIGAAVAVRGTSTGTVTDTDGTFKLQIPAEAKSIVISYTGMEEKIISVEGKEGDLGTIAMAISALGLDEVVVTGTVDIVKDRRTPVAVSTITSREIQAKSVGNVEFPEVMKNTPSVYVSNQTGFGDSQMFLRGFGQRNTAFLLNGQPINGMEDGRMYWSNWSGMSDVANAVQIQRGLGSSKLAISSVGGTVNIVMKSAEKQEGGYARVMYGNDNYLKGTVAYNSGLKGKWAYSFLLDHWQADNKWAEGTRGQGQNYFFSVGYQPSDKSSFNFLVTGAPQWHGQRWSQSEETLKETPKFNQHFGEFDGEWESERRNFYHKPVINLTWDYDINGTSSLSSVAYASFGRGGGTGPYGSSRNRIRTAEGGVDFDAINAANLADDDGIGGFSDNYALRASMNNHQWYGNVTKYETALNENITWSVGTDLRWYTGDHFRQFANLLGLDGWQDSFRHSTRGDDYVVNASFKPSPWTALFNFADEEERIAYDYSEDINYQGAFTQVEYATEVLTVFAQGAVSNQSYQRNGRWADQGESEKVSKIGYNVKGGASISPDASNTIFANVGYYSRQPFLDNIFENIRYSNALLSPEVDNEDVFGVELGYKLRLRDFYANVNLYNTSWGNRTNTSVFVNDNNTPDDEEDDFNQLNIERGIQQTHRGLEFDLGYKMDKLTIKGYASFGDWTFDDIESVTVFNDDTGVLLREEDGIELNDVHIWQAPQTSMGVGLTLKPIDKFTIDLDYNFYDRLYRRNNFDSGAVYITEDIGTLPSYSLLDAGIGYFFDMNAGKGLSLRANVYNLLNNDYLNQSDAFGVLNGNGLTWNVSAKYTF